MSAFNESCEVLDVRGLSCPQPMLKTKKALAKMASGAKLLVLATDPHAVRDLNQFADQTGNVFVGSEEKDGVFEIIIQRKPS